MCKLAIVIIKMGCAVCHTSEKKHKNMPKCCMVYLQGQKY